MDSAEQIDRFKEFIELNYVDKLHDIIRKGHKSLVMSFVDLDKFDLDLAEELLKDPDNVIKSAEIALEQFNLSINLKARFRELPKSQNFKIRTIRSDNLNYFISIEGIVRRASDVRPQVISSKFECPSCGNTMTILQLDSKFKEPTRCSCGRKGRFRLIHKDLVDAQHLTIEEPSDLLEGGEQPKRLTIFLREDLVDPDIEKRNTPGSRVMVTGIVREIPIILKTGIQSTRFDIGMDANYIEPVEESFIEIEISEKDEKEIKDLANDPDIYGKLVNSIATSIYGHEKIKEAIVLQLMGGVKKFRSDGTQTRGDLHILLVGDPGSGKSQLLTFVSKAAPKARFVSGKGASGAGLTASVVRDDVLKGWALEAGALVLGSGGYCMIDELDKMSEEDTSAMHQALEQQIVSISKANIQATLRAETTVLAAANPKFGRFDPYTPIAQQIDLPPALINRFDLIFTVRDLPNIKRDEGIATHVLETQYSKEGMKAPIDKDLLKKYISYVKQRIFPKLTAGAVDEIRSFYVNLRSSGGGGDDVVKPIPISARQLEALVRLAEASAKIRLSDKVTRRDAKRSIELMKYCLMQVGFDPETGQIDIDRFGGSVPASTRGKIISVRGIIDDLEKRMGKSIPVQDIIREASERGIGEREVEEALLQLSRSGDIYHPKPNIVEKV